MDIPAPILLVDDEPLQQDMLKTSIYRRIQLRSKLAMNGQDALKILKEDESSRAIKVVVMDLNMPVMDGMETLEVIKKKYPDLPVIMLTGSNDLGDAVQAMKLGAIDFVSKPCNAERLCVSIKNAMKISLLSTEVKRLQREVKGAYSFSDLIGFDRGLKNVVALGQKAADSNIPILVMGETGVGKELFAKAIHGASKRRAEPFVAINCGAIPSQLVESTLFGHEKGAFTGATSKALGKFREAEGGTVFLDEIGELPMEAQVKLLRVIQQKEVEPVGGGKPIPIDVRIISATNRDLQEELKEGRFREDLYFRLNVFELVIPPLRKRKEDIPELVEYFLTREAALHGGTALHISNHALQNLLKYDWPGNVRQLENTIHKAMILSDGSEIHISSLGERSSGDVSLGASDAIEGVYSEGGDKSVYRDDDSYSIYNGNGSLKTVEQVEKDMIAIALKMNDQNITQTSKMLGIAKSTLYRKISELEISP
jgi:DNA-binding NtrC family response regulator